MHLQPARAERARPGGSARAEGAKARESGRPPRARSEGSEPSEERGEHLEMEARMIWKTLMVLALSATAASAQQALTADEIGKIKKEVNATVHRYYQLFTQT